jgi:hypothetical protein
VPRAGRCGISPLGVSAASIPANANTSTPTVRDTSPTLTAWSMRSWPGWMKNAPTATNSSSGTSLATVASSITRAPVRTPRTLTQESARKMTTITTGTAKLVVVPPPRTTTEPANRLATAAVAAMSVAQSSAPASRPTNGPSATST